ncbi:MAG: hypothetical protein HLUCCO07_02490 [Rhodobacteraceae bacterium HLUCCO07]|nr:MAG: hypothetical protein HLUCCO07_02490 [Rhodobacteraceae bacterium HLUCCO07]
MTYREALVASRRGALIFAVLFFVLSLLGDYWWQREFSAVETGVTVIVASVVFWLLTAYQKMVKSR